MIKNIIWDFDGTLFDTYPAIANAYQAALLDLGFDMPLELFDALARVSMDYCIDEITRRFEVDESAFLERMYAHYGELMVDMSPPFPGALDVCRKIIERGGKNFLVTHRRRESAEILMAHHKIEDLFADGLYGDDGSAHKPDPAMFNHIIEKHGLVREETLSVGDRSLDIEAGKAAGIKTCLFIKLETAMMTADSVIFSYDEIVNMFEE